MKTTASILAIAIACALAMAQAPSPQTAAPKGAGRGGPRVPEPMPPGPDPNSQYRLGPDSMPQDGVPKGEIRGPYHIQSKAYPGTQHTYWVYVPAQYDPAVPAALMVFQDGQAFKDPNGDLRAQNVMDNLIYRREIPVMIGVFINPGRTPEQVEPSPETGWGDGTTNRGTEYNTPDDKYARVDHRRADAGAEQGIQHFEGPRNARHRRLQFRRHRRVRGCLGAPQRVPQSAQQRRQLRRSPRRLRLSRARAGQRKKADSRLPLRRPQRQPRHGRGGAYDEKRDWFYQNVRLMKALTQKGYDVNYSWGMNLHGQKYGGVILPDMMRWLWRDGPVSTDPNDMVERGFPPAGDEKELGVDYDAHFEMGRRQFGRRRLCRDGFRSATGAAAAPPGAAQAGRGRGAAPPPPPPIDPKPGDLAKIREKTAQIEKLVADLKAKHADPVLLNDVEVYAKAGHFLLEYPELFGTQAAVDHSLTVLDQGIERATQLQSGKPEWDSGPKRIEAYRSEIDGALQPYGITLARELRSRRSPCASTSGCTATQNNTTEAEFIYNFLRPRPPGNAPVADQGQIQLDCFGRINGAGWHWAGEADVFEGIATVKKRYRIDDKRIVLRGFSQGGEGAWHISLHHPDAFVAAEVGAGTVSRSAQRPGMEPYQLATLKIWENISEWALNIYNLPLAGHDGENDPGQLESSLRARAQLEKEGFPSEGERDDLHSVGAPGLWMQSLNTGHGTSPLVRQRLDAFLREWGDKGQVSPDHIKFVTYTTRYNKDYWVSVDGMDRHYERADVDAVRTGGGASFEIKTHNVTRLVLREMDHAKEIKIDGQNLKAPSRAEFALQKTGTTWRVDRSLAQTGLHKTHALQGPIDDAFLDPFLLVRPTGAAWNDDVNQQALRSMARFDRMWGKFFRGHPFVKDDKDVTARIWRNITLFCLAIREQQLIAKLTAGCRSAGRRTRSRWRARISPQIRISLR